MAKLRAQVTELTSKLTNVTTTLETMATNMNELLKRQLKTEQDPKERESLLKMLAKLGAVMALMGFSTVEEAAPGVVKPQQ